MTSTEILSWYAFAILVSRNNTCNMTKVVTELLRQIKERFDDYPRLVQFDDGNEFHNIGVKMSDKQN